VRIIKMNNTENTKQINLNWNGLTDKQNEFIKRIINNEIKTSCNQLVEVGFKGIQTKFGYELLEFENSTYEDGEYKPQSQFFIVSSWLAEHLLNHGSMVGEFLDFHIWARVGYNFSLEDEPDLKDIVKSLS
tara:strand:- start:57 stop:449 length:393 start_codon:yes stop_codon:yes gene_type:complete